MVRWEELSMPEKAEMMKVAIRNGITTLPEIKQAYREFAEGGDISTNETDTYNVEGNLFKKGGSKKKATVNPAAQRAMRYFMDKGLTDYQAAGLVGNLMRESGMNPNAVNGGSQAYGLAQWLGPRKEALFSKYGNNPTFENQLDFIWSELNSTHRNGLKHIKASKSAEEAARNAMGYYEFSVGPAGAIANMKKYGQDGEGSMMKGIGFASRLMGQPVSTSTAYSDSPQLPITETIPQEDFSFTPMNPQVFGMQMPTYQTPVIAPEQPLVTIAEQTTPTPEQIERQRIMQERAEQRDALNRFGLLMSMSNPQQGNDMMGAIGMLAGLSNSYRSGGDIHIKPSHRGRFTELKERTGHSASWFKEHGTPAQKKMATFALNAAKWKHGYGGILYGDGGPESKGGIFDYLNRAFDQYRNLRKNVNRKLRLKDNSYIGGSSKETRQKYFDTDKEFTDSVISISERYGLNPNLTASRIAREGPIDMAINMYNGYTDYPKGSIWSEERVETKGPEWGLDDLGSNIKGGNVNITTSAPYSWKDAESTNKHGRLTNTIESPQWWFGIEGTAAELKARRDKLKKNNPWMDEATLDEAASMSYNHGEKGAQDYIDKHHRVKPGFKPFIKIK